MAEFEIIPAKPWHVGQILRRLRAAQKNEIATLGIRSHQELSRRFNESSFKRAWTIDGRLAALGGVTGSLISTSGMVWLAMSDECARYPRQTALTARQQLAEILETRHEVTTLMLAGDKTSMRWIRFLEFEPLGAPRQDGTLLMVRRRET